MCFLCKLVTVTVQFSSTKYQRNQRNQTFVVFKLFLDKTRKTSLFLGYIDHIINIRMIEEMNE